MARAARPRALPVGAAPAAGPATSARGSRVAGRRLQRRGARELAPDRIPAREDAPREQVAGIQRSRLLAGALGAIDEHGYAQLTVAQITRRARVSRRTFYELFENREACLLALLDDAVAAIAGELRAADLGALAWHERVRGGLSVILCFFEREPALARVLLEQSAQGGPRVRERRAELQARLAAALEEGREVSARAEQCGPLTAEGLVGAAVGIVGARLAPGSREPLADLLGELTGMIVLPYLGARAARRERARPAPQVAAGRRVCPRVTLARDPLDGVHIRMTYRTARVLEAIAREPGISNRMVAESAGIHDQGQVSKLLARIERLGLTAKVGEGHAKGEPNAWQLTATGERVAQAMHHTPTS
ncbi:MAG TPA: TetR/AcrR family transcriptional regulator [Solirubrobacteraceae bacterium]|jgi:AcrR family transcriptional regulator|nr:TetR/AcrR family transcriptional regulator [Solirubrobacteraceae bacterium]